MIARAAEHGGRYLRMSSFYFNKTVVAPDSELFVAQCIPRLIATAAGSGPSLWLRLLDEGVLARQIWVDLATGERSSTGQERAADVTLTLPRAHFEKILANRAPFVAADRAALVLVAPDTTALRELAQLARGEALQRRAARGYNMRNLGVAAAASDSPLRAAGADSMRRRDGRVVKGRPIARRDSPTDDSADREAALRTAAIVTSGKAQGASDLAALALHAFASWLAAAAQAQGE